EERASQVIAHFAEIRTERDAVRTSVLVTGGADATEHLAPALRIAGERGRGLVARDDIRPAVTCPAVAGGGCFGEQCPGAASLYLIVHHHQPDPRRSVDLGGVDRSRRDGIEEQADAPGLADECL